jgi:hypothetical protein
VEEKSRKASQVLLWQPGQDIRKRGRPAITFVVQLKKDTELTTEELKTTMDDREDQGRRKQHEAAGAAI